MNTIDLIKDKDYTSSDDVTPPNIVAGKEARVHNLPPSPDRWKLRSVTYTGIAEAMATQWGGVI